MVPPLRRYYGMLRLPAAHLAALRCLRLAIPPLRPVRSRRLGRTVGGTGSWYSGSRAGNVSGDGRTSQVPEQPSCPRALFLDPGRTDARHGHDGVSARPPLVSTTVAPASKDFGARSHGIGTRCLRFAVEVARHHARLASGCWLSFAGRDSFTRRVAMKGFRVRVSSSFLELA